MSIPDQLFPCQAYKQGLIETLALRTLCALHEMDERRRYTPSRPAHYRVPECHKLLGSRGRVSQVEKALEH